jgi:hypothetical protein
MNDNKRKIKKIGLNSYLIYTGNEIFYFLSFEVVDIIKVKVTLIKMLKTETYVFQSIIQFNAFGTNDAAPQDALNTVSNLMLSYNFVIKEQNNKVMLYLNSQNKGSIELHLYNKNNESNKESIHKVTLDNMHNRIQELLNTISMQDQKINELQQREETHKDIMNKVEQITSRINFELDKEECNKKKNQFNNKNNFNPYTNNINPNNPYVRVFTQTFNNPYGNNNLNNNNSNVKLTVNTVYSPYLPENANVNSLLTRTDIQGSLPVPKVEQKRIINLDSIQNSK